MLVTLIRRRPGVSAIVGIAIAALVVAGVLVAVGGGDDDETLVIYNGRSHYGDEDAFKEFEENTGITIQLRGGTAPELFQRLDREGSDTPADVLVTTDLANLWRAEEAGLLEPVDSETLRAQVPDRLHATDGSWWAVTTRLRVPVVSTERVAPGRVTSYEDLGDPEFKGRTCLRTSNSEYNQSMVADMIAKRGKEATEALLRSWMANDVDILGSDGEMLAVMASGRCDLGLANHYYLARALAEDPNFPVAPAWPDQDGAGAHANVSGAGVVRGSDQTDDAVKLIEWLTSPPAQRELIERGEFAVNPEVGPPPHLADWAGVTTDPIDVEQAGPLLAEAIQLMLDVGWK